MRRPAQALTLDERLAVANKAVETGSESGLFPADETTAAYPDGRARSGWIAQQSDVDANIARRISPDLTRLPPARLANDDAKLVVDLDAQTAVVSGRTVSLLGLHPFILEAVAAGGFVEWARGHPPEPVAQREVAT